MSNPPPVPHEALSRHPRIAALRQRLRAYEPVRVPLSEGSPRAAVALVVRPAHDDLELLLIQRTSRAGDPWSGHMAFPGGRSEPGDIDPLATAIREAREEVAVDLQASGTLLGALDDTHPRMSPVRIVVSPYVFSVPASTLAIPNHEVDATVWIPLRQLLLPAATTEHLLERQPGETLRFPALTYEGYVIWGLTHRILSQFLSLAAQAAERSS